MRIRVQVIPGQAGKGTSIHRMYFWSCGMSNFPSVSDYFLPEVFLWLNQTLLVRGE